MRALNLLWVLPLALVLLATVAAIAVVLAAVTFTILGAFTEILMM